MSWKNRLTYSIWNFLSHYLNFSFSQNMIIAPYFHFMDLTNQRRLDSNFAKSVKFYLKIDLYNLNIEELNILYNFQQSN